MARNPYSLPKIKSKMVGDYKRTKNITSSPREIIDSYELLCEFIKLQAVTFNEEKYRKWVISEKKVSPILVGDVVNPGIKYAKWLVEL